MRDRLVFGIRDVKVRERLLRESQLTLKKTYEICLASDSTAAQLKELVRETRCIRSMSDGYLVEDVVTTQTIKPTRQQKNPVIVGLYITQITASLAGKHAVIAEKLITSRPYAEVESAETCRQHK